jgi:transmembrane sensor
LKNNYHDYLIDDFIADDYFCEWVLNPYRENIDFWTQWIEQNPDRVEVINKAKEEVVKLKSSSSHLITKEVISQTWDDIASKMDKTHETRGRLFTWIAAASITMLIGSFALLYFDNLPTNSKEIEGMVSSAKWIEYTNDSESIWRVELSDGSTVVLEPQSFLKYPLSFEGKNRNVILKGEGFFDIERDTLKPFYVYANDAVIRVLGTSFYVKAKEEDAEVEVIVKTGKVAVYRSKEINQFKKVKVMTLKPLVVTPNQKVVLNKESQEMSRRLTSTPSLIKPLSELGRLIFENTPATEILSAIEKAYGVEIKLAEGTIADCTLSTTLSEETLYEKLEIVCHPLGLTYHEDDGRIIIHGNCK